VETHRTPERCRFEGWMYIIVPDIIVNKNYSNNEEVSK